MIYLVTIILGWIAYAIDYLIILQIDMAGISNPKVLYWYLVRSLVYLLCIYSVTRCQMKCEGYMRSLGSKLGAEDIQYWYSTLCSHIPHILLPSLIRVVSDAVPLMIFIFVMCFEHNDIRVVIFNIFSILLIYLTVFYLIQSHWSRKASQIASKVISNLTHLNNVEKKISHHSMKKQDFIKTRKNQYIEKYVNINSGATAFSQTIRYQVELVAILIFAWNASIIPQGATTFYVLFRLANAGFQMLGILSGIGQYRFYFFQAQKLVPEISIFGSWLLKILMGKEKN